MYRSAMLGAPSRPIGCMSTARSNADEDHGGADEDPDNDGDDGTSSEREAVWRVDSAALADGLKRTRRSELAASARSEQRDRALSDRCIRPNKGWTIKVLCAVSLRSITEHVYVRYRGFRTRTNPTEVPLLPKLKFFLISVAKRPTHHHLHRPSASRSRVTPA